MYPPTLLLDEVKSTGEIKVFDALRDQLSDEWEAYHSASWMMRDPAEGSKDGEIDFVLCHPDHGILCLEVKGGGIECQHGAWFRWIDGNRKRVKDPFLQALDHTYALRRKIETVDGWKKHNLSIGHSVVFPDITVHELTMSPDADPEIVLDRNDLKDIQAGIDRILAYHSGAREKRDLPGDEGAD